MNFFQKYRLEVFLAGVGLALLLGIAFLGAGEWPGDAAGAPPAALLAPMEYASARVIDVKEKKSEGEGGGTLQLVQAKIISGKEKGKKRSLRHGPFPPFDERQKVSVGQNVILAKSAGGPQGTIYSVYDTYRLPVIFWITAFFFALTLLLGRKRGAYSIIGLLFSLFVLVRFIAPGILAGRNPLLTSIEGAILIAMVSLYLAHGFNKKTTLAVISTLFTLGLAALMAFIAVALSRLTGMGTEAAFYLQLGLESLNVKGLLLGGIIIGTLGVLDDITVTQVAIVHELKEANPDFSFQELYKRALSVGKEHIASLVNTLVLAYAGASFPLFLLFTIDKEVPLWVNLNNEYVAEEIIRTLVGSTALLLAVPIATFLAAYSLKRKSDVKPFEL